MLYEIGNDLLCGSPGGPAKDSGVSRCYRVEEFRSDRHSDSWNVKSVCVQACLDGHVTSNGCSSCMTMASLKKQTELKVSQRDHVAQTLNIHRRARAMIMIAPFIMSLGVVQDCKHFDNLEGSTCERAKPPSIFKHARPMRETMRACERKPILRKNNLENPLHCMHGRHHTRTLRKESQASKVRVLCVGDRG